MIRLRVFIVGDPHPIAEVMSPAVPRIGDHVSVMHERREVILVTWDFMHDGSAFVDVHVRNHERPS